jgi:hypothetical protein
MAQQHAARGRLSRWTVIPEAFRIVLNRLRRCPQSMA